MFDQAKRENLREYVLVYSTTKQVCIHVVDGKKYRRGDADGDIMSLA